MKKKILKAAFVAAFAMIAGYGVYNSQKDVVLSDLALANVEALASGEGSGTCRWKRTADSYGCPVHSCVANGDGNICKCGSVQ